MLEQVQIRGILPLAVTGLFTSANVSHLNRFMQGFVKELTFPSCDPLLPKGEGAQS
jgi:hypothetical protein